jgi:hypothetical protein
MSDNHGAFCKRDTPLENFAAELTSAAYFSALRRGMRCSWIKVELDLWEAVAETVKKWTGEWPPAGSSNDNEVWQNGLLEDLTEGAFHIALKHGVKGSPLDVELGLYRTFRLVIRRHCRANNQSEALMKYRSQHE